MPAVKSLDDLRRVREEAIEKRKVKTTASSVQVIVGMGTVGIAAGARETLKAILEFIEKEKLADITVRQTGNIGLDSFEPVVQVVVGDTPKVTYGKVTPDAARLIMKQHVVGRNVVKDYVIET